ncbi:unnamed protein product, partial [Nesidiocoris tenuis]
SISAKPPPILRDPNLASPAAARRVVSGPSVKKENGPELLWNRTIRRQYSDVPSD